MGTRDQNLSIQKHERIVPGVKAWDTDRVEHDQDLDQQLEAKVRAAASRDRRGRFGFRWGL